MRNTDEFIHQLIEHNERLVQLAIVSAENGEEQSVNDIVNGLYRTFLKIYEYRSKRQERYAALMFSTIPPLSPIARYYGSKTDPYNEYSFPGSFRTGFYRIWTQAYKSSLWSTSNSLVFKVQKILDTLTQEEDNGLLLNEFLFLLMQISSLGLSKRGEADTSFVDNPTFQWYFNLGLNAEYKKPFQLEYQRKYYDAFFWRTLKRIVNNNSFELFRSFVSSLHHGAHSTFLSRNNIYGIFNIPRVSATAEREISAIEHRFLRTTNVSDYIEYTEKVSEIVVKYEGSLRNGTTVAEAIEILVTDANKNFKSTTLSIYIYLLGAYLVFKENFKWINYLWEFQQPNDADATWGAHSFVPSDLPTIFRFLLNEDNYSDRVQFEWEEHHGASSYYRKYGILLIARLYFIPKFYVFQDNILNPHVLISNVNFKEYDHLISLCDDLKRYVSILDVFEKFKDVNVNEDEGNGVRMPIKQAIVNLLENIKTSTQAKQRIVRVNRQFTNEDLDAFLENVNFNYKKENQIAKIFEAVKPAVGEVLATNQLIEYPKTIGKDEFIAQWEYYGANIGFEVARNLAWLFTARILNIMSGNQSVEKRAITERDIHDFFKGLSQTLNGWDRPVIVGTGINFNGLLWEDKNFKPLDSEDANHKVGLYKAGEKAIDIYSISNWNYTNSFFIVDAELFGDLSLTQPQDQEQFKIKEFIKLLFEDRPDEQGQPQFYFLFSVYYEFRFKANPRGLRIRITE
jgi:hypothetical protein